QETLTKALEANHRLAAHIRGESGTSTDTPKPATAGTPTTPGTPGTDTKVNTNTNVKIVDLSVLSPRVETRTENVDDKKDAKPAPTGEGDAAKPTNTQVNTDTNVSIFDLSLLSPRVKTNTTTTTADQATIKALQDAVVLRDKLIVGRDQIIVKRDVEIARLRVLLLQKGINPDQR
ncbi:MAG TPA: hypothetical protein VMX57_02420, partial [Planctomycetota bacterium]|nr:hypothetical protein [Planctomycetota bacterium]